jgi:hypothetical protein
MAVVGGFAFGDRQTATYAHTQARPIGQPAVRVDIAGLTKDFERVLLQIDEFVAAQAAPLADPAPAPDSAPTVDEDVLHLLQKAVSDLNSGKADRVGERIKDYLESQSIDAIYYEHVKHPDPEQMSAWFEIRQRSQLEQPKTHLPALVRDGVAVIRGVAEVPQEAGQ